MGRSPDGPSGGSTRADRSRSPGLPTPRHRRTGGVHTSSIPTSLVQCLLITQATIGDAALRHRSYDLRRRARPMTDATAVPINLFENDRELMVVAPMPGVSPEDITIDVTDDGHLTVRSAQHGE